MLLLLSKHFKNINSMYSRAFFITSRVSSAVKSAEKPGSIQKQREETNKQDFTQIYKNPHIVSARFLCRLKLYQTGLTTGLVPTTGVLYNYNMVDLEICTYIGWCSIMALAVLYVIGNFFRRFVGAMYINSSKDTLKVSHLTFFGNRRDVLMPVEDVIPFTDRGENPRNLYYTLQRYSTGQKYFYIIRSGGILQPKEFQLVTGVNCGE